MLHQIVFFFLFSAVCGAAEAQLEASVLLPDAPQVFLDGTECASASAGDYVCGDNCTKVLLCVGDGAGGLRPIELQACEDGYSCDARAGRCVNETNACAVPDNTINCNGIGMFPDPYSCSVFHICAVSGQQSVRGTCDNGWAYDPLTTVCSKPSTDSICSELPIECTQVGSTGVMPGNPSIYYICAYGESDTVHPELYRCPRDEIYDPSLYSCVENNF